MSMSVPMSAIMNLNMLKCIINIVRIIQQICSSMVSPLATFLGEDDTVCLGELLNGVFVGGDVHDWHTRYLPDPLLQSFITSGNNVTSVLSHPLHHTIIRIRPLVHAGKTGEARILGHLQGHPVLSSQLLQLPNDTISDTWNV